MPNPLIKKLAKEENLSLYKVEKYWDKAKKIASKKFDKASAQYYPYLVGILKNMVGASFYKAQGSQDMFNLIEEILQYLNENFEGLTECTNISKNLVQALDLTVAGHKKMQDVMGAENDDIIDCGLFVVVKGILLTLNKTGKENKSLKELKNLFNKLNSYQSDLMSSLKDLLKS